MEQKFETMSLVNIKNGAAVELFDSCLSDVIMNVMDPNTGSGKREIILKIVFKPNENRERMDIAIQCSTKLAALKTHLTSAFVAEAPEVGVCAIEPDLAQLGLFKKKEPVKVSNVTPFRQQG